MKTRFPALLAFTSCLLMPAHGQAPTAASETPAPASPAQPPSAAETPAQPAAPEAPTPAATEPAPSAAMPAPIQAPAAGDRVLPVAQPAPGALVTIAGALDVAAVSASIREQPIENREKLLQELSGMIENATKGIAELIARSANVEGSQKESLDAAVAAYQKKRSDLDAAIAAARSATPDNWVHARAILSAEYAFFTSAVASVEVAAP